MFVIMIPNYTHLPGKTKKMEDKKEKVIKNFCKNLQKKKKYRTQQMTLVFSIHHVLICPPLVVSVNKAN